MFTIPSKVDFYITNVCNLTCEDCNRFNNHNFRGWQRWSKYESEYQKWGQLVNLKAATIMGGEPFLNPTLGDWIEGINTIFGIEVQVLTNGTRFRHSGDLYQKFLYWSDKNQCQNHIGVSLHNPDQFDRLHNDVVNFLQGPVKIFPKGHPDNKWNSDWYFVDQNNVVVNVYVVDNFVDASLKQVYQTTNLNLKSSDRLFKLHNSDPDQAHRNCSFAKFKSYHFIRGKFYKCAPVALWPEFDQQHNIDLTDQDRQLLTSYRALDTENFAEYYRQFFEELDNPIAQCKFCPEQPTFKKIFPIQKGSR